MENVRKMENFIEKIMNLKGVNFLKLTKVSVDLKLMILSCLMKMKILLKTILRLLILTSKIMKRVKIF
jgi:hypothetical protein